MKSKFILLSTLFVLAFACSASAQDTPQEPTSWSVDTTAAAWGKYFVDNSSKAEEYGRVPEGFIINHFRAAVELKEDRSFVIRGDRVGNNNASYTMNYGKSGKYGIEVDYANIPHLFSKDGHTIWTEIHGGIWRLPDADQTTIENLNPVPPTDPTYAAGLAAQHAFVSSLLTTAHPIHLQLVRHRGDVDFVYTPSLSWKYAFQYYMENRNGLRPFGTSFGFSWDTELPEHIDYDTERVRAGVEWMKGRSNFAFNYEMTRFNNDVKDMIWDNPLRITDRTYAVPFGAYINGDGTSQGRVQLPIDNLANTFSATGGADLGKGRLTGQFAYSIWTDHLTLLPETINTAIVNVPPSTDHFHGKLQNISGYLRYNTHFAGKGKLTASYRLYDMRNNNTDIFFTDQVRLDQNLEDFGEFNPLLAFLKQTFDVEAGWQLTPKINWNVGYDYMRWSREDREVKRTATNSFRTNLTALLSESLTARVTYQYSFRRFTGLDLDSGDPLFIDIPIRRMDTANLNQNLLRGIVDYMLGQKSTFGFYGEARINNYPDSEFGRLKSTEYHAGVDYTYELSNASSFNLFYEHGRVYSDQRGRQSGAVPSTNPADNWMAQDVNNFDTLGAGYTRDLMRPGDTWATTISYARADGRIDLSSPPGGSPNLAVSIPNSDKTDLVTFKTGVNFRMFPRTKLGVLYWFEHYRINDFAEDVIKADLIQQASTILLNARQPSYNFHAGWIGLIFAWGT